MESCSPCGYFVSCWKGNVSLLRGNLHCRLLVPKHVDRVRPARCFQPLSTREQQNRSTMARFKTRRIDFTKAVMCGAWMPNKTHKKTMSSNHTVVPMCLSFYSSNISATICQWYLEASGNATVSRACSNRHISNLLVLVPVRAIAVGSFTSHERHGRRHHSL